MPDENTSRPRLVVLDDLMTDATKDEEVSNLFTVGSHHRNLSVICLLQNLFNRGKENRTMNLNSQYLVLFKNPRDLLQVTHLARQMYPHNTGYFMEQFQKATAKPYGCLVVDLKQDTRDGERLRSGVILEPFHKSTTKPYDCSIVDTKQDTQDGERLRPSIIPGNDEQPPDKKEEFSGVNTCNHCGVCFRTAYYLNMHMQSGCAMQDDDSEEEGVNPWAKLLQRAFDKHDELYRDKVDKFMGEGLDQKESAHRSSHELLPKYRKSLMQLYSTFLEEMHALGSNSQHKEIMRSIDWYMGWKGYDFQKALETTLQKKKHLFEQIIEENDDTDDEDDMPLSKLSKRI